MKATKTALTVSLILTGFVAAEVHAATEWNVSLWGKRRAFTRMLKS
ncbi:TRAP-type C4-dicarboxylate transport system periplasmic component [Vibrio maritimus]|uniref:TRAP-type C4-dicarboxylate transport system periplasmic component n=1 Tax=Vibrio maritimus TaxID=990268 RepID=A0A090T1A3_9VIBR|nr:TRAP-type C4-dicarboxylate transport system periplasmic component [Vibrio maritimus]